MLNTPKGLRLQIGIFGKRNAGKSSVLNAIVKQDVVIVSDFPGTTTDPVDKAMELQPLGPVLLIDTAGIDDDAAEIGAKRVERSRKVIDRCDMALLVFTADSWSMEEEELAAIFNIMRPSSPSPLKMVRDLICSGKNSLNLHRKATW